MEKVAESAVVRVIEAMRGCLGEPITIDDMARVAAFSKFHFSRVFQRATGISPGRFLSAMRLQEAKRLLVTTSLSVTDISHRVGYSSVGTFSSRFRNSVGISPSAFRRFDGFTSRICLDKRHRLTGMRPATIRGRIAPPVGKEVGLVFVGLFPDRMPEGQPVKCAALDEPGAYTLDDVPQGTWHLLTYSVPARNTGDGWSKPGAHNETTRDGNGRSVGRNDLFVGASGPITIRANTAVWRADVRLRPMNTLDPPVLLALLDSSANRMLNRKTG